MFAKKGWLHFGLVLAAVFLFGPLCKAQVITCNSDDMHRHFCDVNTRGRVRLLKQHSNSPCREGYSWGQDRQGIWVDHGCRAEFALVDDQGGRWEHRGDHDWDRDHGHGVSIVSCNSDDMHRHFCDMDTRGGVSLYRQHSGSPCRQGYSWGYDRRGIWVDRGCRAEFQVGR